MTEKRSGHTEEIAFPTAPGPPDLPTRIGRYEILAELGSGGMASVYLGRLRGPAGFSKLFAIKRVHPHLVKDRLFVDMFLDEARIAAVLQHPHVAQVIELGVEDGGEHFIAMEYLHGEHLAALARAARSVGGLPIALASAIVAHAAEGLHHAHEARDDNGHALGIVHRDVTPHNIFVTYEGNVKLTDFGIAKAEGRIVRTDTGTVKGKFAYMAPEQALGRAIDRRVDVFALGVVLWELVTDQRLFRGDTDAETLLAVTRCEVQAPSSRRPDCPADLDGIVVTCLAREPSDRFDTTQAVAAALDRVVEKLGGVRTRDIATFMQRAFAQRIVERQRWLHARADAPAARGEDPITHVAKKRGEGETAQEPDATTPSGTVSVSVSMLSEAEAPAVPLVRPRADASTRVPSEGATPDAPSARQQRIRVPSRFPELPSVTPPSRRGATVAALGVVAVLAVALGALSRCGTTEIGGPAQPTAAGMAPGNTPNDAAIDPAHDAGMDAWSEPSAALAAIDAAVVPDAWAPSPPSPIPTRRRDAATSPPRSPPPSVAPPPPVDTCPAVGTGSVDFECPGHWAYVWVDARAWPEEAPVMRQRVPAGRHTFEFQIDGAGSRRTVTRCVSDDRTTRIRCSE